MKRDAFQEQLVEARRNQIIDAAIKVVSKQGFRRTTIKQIAKEAGVADGTIYNYFTNKDDILMGIVARLSVGESQDINTAEARELDFADFVSMFVNPRMDDIVGSYQALKAVLPEMINDAETGRNIYEQIYAPMFAVMEGYFERLIADGQVEGSDPALATRLFASPFMGLLMLWMLGDEHIIANWDSYTKAMEGLLLKAFHNGEMN